MDCKTPPAKLCKSSEMAAFSFIFNSLTESVWQVLKNSLPEQLHGPLSVAFLKNQAVKLFIVPDMLKWDFVKNCP